MALQEIRVPDIGDYSGVDIIEIMVKVGDEIKEEDSLLTLETDKATMEIPSPMAGKVAEIVVKEGDKVSEGDLIIKVEAASAASKAADAAPLTPTPSPAEGRGEQSSASTQASASSVQEIKVPDIGDYSNVDVIEIIAKVGDTVAQEDSLLTLETDKATMEIPSPVAGKIVEAMVKEGDKVSQGDLIFKIETLSPNPSPVNGRGEQASVPAKSAEPVQQVAAPVADKPEKSAPGVGSASPSVRRLARELGIELSQVGGSGRKGRVTREDLNQLIKSRMQGGGSGVGLDLLADPKVDFAKFGEIKTEPLSRIKKISGANLQRNWIKIPHINFFEDADITEMEAFRKAKRAEFEKKGLKLTPVPFLVKAVAKALKAFPNMNSSLSADGQNLVMKQYVHVGVAVDTPNGLMVPVIRDCDKKSLTEITQDFLALIAKARDGKLKGEDMQGGCFTISSLGGIGTTGFTPIVNMPEVGILGVSTAKMKPVYDGHGGFAARLMLPLSLSVDHRVIDGAEAAQFVVAIANYLSDIKEMLL